MTPHASPRIALLVTDDVSAEDLDACNAAFARSLVASMPVAPDGRIRVRGRQGHVREEPARAITPTLHEEFSGLVVLTGPSALAGNQAAVELIRSFADTGRTVGAARRATGLLIRAGVVAGRRVTSGLADAAGLLGAGGRWTEDDLIRDGNLITASTGDVGVLAAAVIAAVREQPVTPDDVLDDTLEDTFPASDPPAVAGPSL